MKIVIKCDMGGYMIEPEKYNRNQSITLRFKNNLFNITL